MTIYCINITTPTPKEVKKLKINKIKKPAHQIHQNQSYFFIIIFLERNQSHFRK